MQKKSKLIAGNWKMHGLRGEVGTLVRALMKAGDTPDTETLICPPFTLLDYVAGLLKGSDISLGAQDCHYETKGAYTGDVSAPMLADLGVRYVILGHSERRAQHQETNELVAKKAEAALSSGLVPIICVGETLEVREAGNAEAKVASELKLSLPKLGEGMHIVIAYEPIWAIGTGKTCNGQDIAAMHKNLRQTLKSIDPRLATTRILYGGSVKPENAEDIMTLEEVDGGLIGGASLEADSFLAIRNAAAKNAVGQSA